MSEPLPGGLGFGAPRLSGEVELARRIRNLEQTVGSLSTALTLATNTANANACIIQGVYGYATSLSLPNDATWHYYAVQGAFTVPAGFTRLTFFLAATAGITWSAGVTGNMSVAVASGASSGSQAVIGNWNSANGVTGGTESLTTVLSSSSAGYTAGSPIYVSCAVNVSGASVASSGSAAISGVLLWTRT